MFPILIASLVGNRLNGYFPYSWTLYHGIFFFIIIILEKNLTLVFYLKVCPRVMIIFVRKGAEHLWPIGETLWLLENILGMIRLFSVRDFYF